MTSAATTPNGAPTHRSTASRTPSGIDWRTVILASSIIIVSMGLRQCFGLFQAPISDEIGTSAAAFGFAMALQNLVWGVSQPFIGALADRFGPRTVILGCTALYVLGLLMMATAHTSFIGLDVGAGVMTGFGVAGTGFGVLLGAVARAAPADRRTQVVGIVSAAGTVGILVLAPLGQGLIDHFGWRNALFTYAAIAAIIAALSLLIRTGPRSTIAVEAHSEAQDIEGLGDTLRAAMSHRGFLAMTVSFFACGFQLMFITTHLPRYIGLCGLSPTVGAEALALIGVCNAIGSYVSGSLGRYFQDKHLLAATYLFRTTAIAIYLAVPISATTTLIFAAAMGFTWLGVNAFVSSLIARMFGLRHFNTLFGTIFLSHQLGAFAGSWLGGIVLDATGTYTLAWLTLIAIGLGAATLQWPMDDRPRTTLVPA
jgi:predicted MFS family arabinose efflux permease